MSITANATNIESLGCFFAPISTDVVDGLVGEYKTKLAKIGEVAAFIADELNGGVINYFIEGNRDENHAGLSLKKSAKHLFDPAGATSALDSAYWSRAMQLTDVLNYMPQKRRDEWHEQIRNKTCPSFEEEVVRSTLMYLLNMRTQFLAERVDGIFKGLSGEHVTNQPQGFGKRMIVGYVLNEWHSENYSKCGLINDLRCVIAKFMDRDEPNYSASASLIKTLKGRWGEWVSVDGGALKIRLYKKGTAHIEVHPDMAWRLNSVLAFLYPMAIPANFRTKPTRKPKEVALMQKPLSFAVLDVLSRVKDAEKTIKQDSLRNPLRYIKIPNAKQLAYGDKDKYVTAEVIRVLELIGGVKQPEGYYQFDYNPSEVIDAIIASGCVPDHKSHQYYPTPENLAELAVSLAAIKEGDLVLEPSAGQGGIADKIVAGLVECVEVSALHCKILEEKGHKVNQSDFLKWDNKTLFDAVVMNPPFSEGRWQAHLEAAAKKLKVGGTLVAILPESAKNKALNGFDCEYHGTYDNEFANTSVNVVILKATKQFYA